MKKRILGITLSLCLIATTAFAGFGDGGAFGAMGNYLKRVGTNIIPNVTATYNLGSASKTWDTIYAATVSVTNWVWTGGNVTYLSISGDIETAIAAATAGDTIVLAAGTYTITDDIDIGKKINIVGQGVGQTTIACATASKKVFDSTLASGTIRIANMSVTTTGITTQSVISHRPATLNTDPLIVENVKIDMSGASNQGAFIVQNASAIFRNVTGTVTSSSTVALPFNFQTTGALGSSVTIDIYDTNIAATATAGTSSGIELYDGGTTDLNVNLYNSKLTHTGGTSYGARAYQGVQSILKTYGCTFSGGTADVISANSAPVTLYDTTLVNNTTSGTITYGGTVVSKGATLVDTSTTKSTLLVDANGATGVTGQSAARIDSENTDVAALYITSQVDGSGEQNYDDFAMYVKSEGLGGAAYFYREAIGSLPLVTIFDDNVSTTHSALTLRCDANGGSGQPAVNFNTTSAAFAQPVLQVTQAGAVAALNVDTTTATSTNFKKIATFGGFTLWTSDGTTAEGALTGVEGDICLNGGTGAGQMAYCDAAGTNWTDM